MKANFCKKPNLQIKLGTNISKSGPAYMELMVNPQHQTWQGHPVANLETFMLFCSTCPWWQSWVRVPHLPSSRPHLHAQWEDTWAACMDEETSMGPMVTAATWDPLEDGVVHLVVQAWDHQGIWDHRVVTSIKDHPASTEDRPPVNINTWWVEICVWHGCSNIASDSLAKMCLEMIMIVTNCGLSGTRGMEWVDILPK